MSFRKVFMVTGSRDWPDVLGYLIWNKFSKLPDDWLLIHGNADGVDLLVHEWWTSYDRDSVSVPAKWSKHGKSAGIVRNQAMIDTWAPDYVFAFFTDVQNSKGTKHATKAAATSGMPLQNIIAYKLQDKLQGGKLVVLDEDDWRSVLS